MSPPPIAGRREMSGEGERSRLATRRELLLPLPIMQPREGTSSCQLKKHNSGFADTKSMDSVEALFCVPQQFPQSLIGQQIPITKD